MEAASSVVDSSTSFSDYVYLSTKALEMEPCPVEMNQNQLDSDIIPKLKTVAAMEPKLWALVKGMEDMKEDEACNTTPVLLTHPLAPVGASCCSTKNITHLLDFVLPGTRKGSSVKTQPQLICICDLSSSKLYVIVAKNDKVTIPLDDG